MAVARAGRQGPDGDVGGELQEAGGARGARRDEVKSGNKVWLRLWLHASIVRAHLAKAATDGFRGSKNHGRNFCARLRRCELLVAAR